MHWERDVIEILSDDNDDAIETIEQFKCTETMCYVGHDATMTIRGGMTVSISVR